MEKKEKKEKPAEETVPSNPSSESKAESTALDKMKLESVPYAAEWIALRAQRRRDYERLISLFRWGDMVDITNDIAQECNVQDSDVQESTEISSLSTSSDSNSQK